MLLDFEEIKGEFTQYIMVTPILIQASLPEHL